MRMAERVRAVALIAAVTAFVAWPGRLSPENLAAVGVSFAFFSSVQLTSMVLSPRLAPVHFAPLSHQQRIDWHGRVVGTLFAGVVVWFAMPEWAWPTGTNAEDPTFGSSVRSTLVCR